jgi:DNA-directed RNA polymerase sigma subunit (sigma70/sigma32)
MAKNEFKISAVRYNDTNKSISRYFSEVTKEKILDPEEEARLAVLAKKGDLDARDKIIKSNLRFGISVAKFYANPNSPIEDLISEANKGRKWWNNGLYCKMSRECPGAGWVEGRLTK